MLTRLKVQGFKNLLDVDVEFGPFTCIAGANGTGKSNLFDAIEFLSYLATDTLTEAAQRVRGVPGTRGGDPRDLFWDGYRNHRHRIKLTADMIVPTEVEDDLGGEAQPAATFLRYEVELGYESARDEPMGRLNLLSEDLRAIREPASHLRFPHSEEFRRAVLQHRSDEGVFLSTDQSFGLPLIEVHEVDRRPAKPRHAHRARRTVLSTINTDDYPTILAARREMQSWRRLALEPSALRTPDGLADTQTLGADGSHLAGTLFRIAHAPGDDFETDPDRVYARVAGRLADLTGVGVEGLTVELDPAREVFTLFLQEKGELRLPARALSEGTLRFLALCVLLEDPSFGGIICMEEPENGIHPANLPAMVELVRDLAVDPFESPGDTNPFRQVIVNTHSPGVVQLCDSSDLLLADVRPRPGPNGHLTRALSLLPYRKTWRAIPDRPVFSKADILAYLAAPSGAHLRLPPDLSA